MADEEKIEETGTDRERALARFHTAMRTPRPRRLAAPLLISAALATSAGLPASAAAAPSPLRHDVARVNSHLRIAIEYAPEELFESLRTAEIVCALGRKASEGGEPDVAASDWTTLDQVVEVPAEGTARRIDVAFANADSVLSVMARRYGENAAIPASRGRRLRHSISGTRHGIRIMRTAVGALSKPFDSWRAHECRAASRGVEEALFRTTTGLELINVGMLRLWRLAGLLPA
jgi:hypothetical protein